MTTTPPSKSFCAAIPGAAAGAGGAPADESVALAVAAFAFIGAAMWLFHRFGQRPESTPAPATQPTGAAVLGPAAS